jgi:hypothetical protein
MPHAGRTTISGRLAIFPCGAVFSMSEHRHHLNLIELSALSAIVRLSGDMQKPEIVGLILLAGALIILGAFFGLVAIGAFETQRSAEPSALEGGAVSGDLN